MVFSNESVLKELVAQQDEVAEWAANRQGFFLNLPEGMSEESNPISEGLKPKYSPKGRKEFAKGADLMLVAQAYDEGYTVVTQETERSRRKEITIPAVCRQFDVPCMDVFELVRKEGMELVLKR